jgi:thymidylate synthase (FAD)
VKLLDHGYLNVVEHWGSDERIIEEARQSTGRGFLGWGPIHNDYCKDNAPGRAQACVCGKGGPGDEKLLRFLWENKHSTPFEFAGATIEVQAPIFVFREWHRHRTQSYAEMSARYTPLPDLNYIPTVERLMVNSKTNKQAGTIKGAEDLTVDSAESFRADLEGRYAEAEQCYQDALLSGIPKELARIVLPVGRYSRMGATANLRNWLAFLTLRQALGAQWEIRQYANALHDELEKVFPRTLALFDEGVPR